MQKHTVCPHLLNVVTAMLFFLSHELNTTSITQPNSLPNFGVTSRAVTTTNQGGRFGVCLYNYFLSKNIEYCHGIPALLYPFKYANQLKLYQQEKRVTPAPNNSKQMLEANLTNIHHQYHRIIHLGDINDLQQDMKAHNTGTLYFVDSCAKCQKHMNLTDEKFIQHMASLIAPHTPPPIIQWPKNCVRVAIHVRTGGGFDNFAMLQKQTIRIPSFCFFSSQISRLLTLFPGKKMHAHIFTDDQKPGHIMQKIQTLCPREITFSCRKKGNHHDQNVITDFFSMATADVLIAPYSAFSRMAAIIGNPNMIFITVKTPATPPWIEGKNVITRYPLSGNYKIPSHMKN